MTARPHIVLVHGHDLGRWLSCYGRPSVPSPHLDRFAAEGIVFDRAFATAPLCTPARSSMFTGLYPHQNGLMGLAHAGWRYRDGVRTLPELLADAGYDTALVGLQHEHPDPLVLGFEHVGGLGFLPHADAVVDEAIAWIHGREGAAPFFLTVGIWEGHRPWGSADYPTVDPASVEVPPYLPDNDETRADLAGFYGSIAFLDEHVGRLLAAIDASTAGEDALVIFTTDHGAALPRAKSTLYDSGVEVAMIVRPPAGWRRDAARVAEPVSHLDLVPTLVELAGGRPDPAWEGRSLAGMIRGDEDAMDEDRPLFFEKTHHDGYDPIRAVRTPRWKYVRNFAPGPRLRLPRDLEESRTRAGMGDAHLREREREELYDLAGDPAELHNLADDDAYASVRAERAGVLDGWMRRTGDPLLDGEVPAAERPTRGVEGKMGGRHGTTL